jgi:hypothetical protein
LISGFSAIRRAPAQHQIPFGAWLLQASRRHDNYQAHSNPYVYQRWAARRGGRRIMRCSRLQNACEAESPCYFEIVARPLAVFSKWSVFEFLEE